jgi:hypothetical protein
VRQEHDQAVPGRDPRRLALLIARNGNLRIVSGFRFLEGAGVSEQMGTAQR